MSETDAPPPRRKTGWGLKLALVISVALNLMVAGIVAGAILSRSGPDDVPGLRTLGLGPFALALEREGREAVRGQLGREARGLPDDRRAVAEGLRQIQAALEAEEFDRDAAELALARTRAAAGAIQARGHGALLDYLETVPHEERLRMADRLGRAIRRGGPRPPAEGTRP